MDVLLKNLLKGKGVKIKIVQAQLNNLSLFDANNSMIDGKMSLLFSADALLLVPIGIEIHLLVALLLLLRFLLILNGCNFLHFDGFLIVLLKDETN